MPDSEFLEKLRAALALVETLKSENAAYRDNFDKLKGAYATLEAKHDALTKECGVLDKEKLLAEQEAAHAIQFWKQQHEIAEKELSELKAKGSPLKNIEVLRQQMREELEESQRGKYDLLSRECSKYRDLYYKSRRELEALRLDREQQDAAHSRAIKEIRRSHDEDVKQWETRLIAMQQSIDMESDTERLRICQRERNELELKTTTLLAELDEIRAEKEQLRIETEQNDRVYKRQLAEHLAAAKGLQSEKDSSESKVRALEDEIKQTLMRQDELLTQNSALSKEIDNVNSKLEETVHQLTVEISDVKMAAIKERGNLESTIKAQRDQISEIKSNAKTLSDTVQELRQKIANTEKDALERLRIVREEEWNKISALEAEKSNLERQVSNLQQRASDNDSRESSYRREVSAEQERLKHEIQELSTRIEEIQSANRTLETERERLCSELTHLQARFQEIEGQLALANASVRALKQQTDDFVEKNTSLESQVQRQIHEIDSLKDESQKEREMYSHNVERQKNVLLQERAQLTQKIELLAKERNQLVERTQELDDIVEQQRKLFETKVNSLKEKVRSYKQKSHNLKASLEQEHKKTRMQLDDMRRKQGEFMSFLRSEGIEIK